MNTKSAQATDHTVINKYGFKIIIEDSGVKISVLLGAEQNGKEVWNKYRIYRSDKCQICALMSMLNGTGRAVYVDMLRLSLDKGPNGTAILGVRVGDMYRHVIKYPIMLSEDDINEFILALNMMQ